MMDLKNGFDWTDFDALRRVPFATMGVFLSTLCPVQCGHCAVEATPHLKATPIHTLVRSVEEMSELPDLVAVAITGGEPFFEIKLLKTLVDLLSNAGKRIVIYTSGYWGSAEIVPKTISVLQAIDGLILGIDLYHRAHIPDADLINAIQHARKHGVWITAQVLTGFESESHLDYARGILNKSFGGSWESHARIDECPPVASGRAKNKKAFRQFPHTFDGFCDSINGPTLLRDGTLAACCNEEIVRNKGPAIFRARYRNNLRQSLDHIKNQPILRYLGAFPPAVLFTLALFCSRSKKVKQPIRMCDACWEFIDLFSVMDEAQRKKFDKIANIWLDAGGEKRERASIESPPDCVKANKLNNVQHFPDK